MTDAADDRARRDARDAAAWLRIARRGDLARAWLLSDRIRRRRLVFADASLPRHQQLVWDGTPLDDRRVLVCCYHGLGDTIQFARYLAPLRARARTVAVWAQPRLLPVLRTMDVDVTWLPLHDGGPPRDADVDIEIMELAYAFRTTLETIPARVPYLSAPSLEWQDRGPPRIGLVWRAGDWDPCRSIPFEQLVPLLDQPRVRWYGLQLDPGGSERHRTIRHLDCSSIETTAVCLRSMDLVVSIDSMTAHLAGALGVPIWTLLRRNADWRWLEERADTPWYPTMRLFRQSTEGRWADVIADVGRALSEVVSAVRP